MQKPISTKTHGYLDYAFAIGLMALPWLLSRRKREGAPTALLMGMGASIIPQSMFTDYEWGVNRKMSMRQHLNSDLGLAVMTMAAPWLFGFSNRTWAPFMAAGLAELAIVAMSDDKAFERPAAGPLEPAFEKGKETISNLVQKVRPTRQMAGSH